VAGLYVLQGTQYLLALVTLPFLARVLGPSAWGRVAFMQGVGLYVSLVIEYGFNFSATRAMSVRRDSITKRTRLLTDVLSAKLVLAIPAVVVATVTVPHFGILAPSPVLRWTGLAWGILQGLSFYWYFQGTERLGLIALLEGGSKLVAAILVFSFVRSPADDWLVLGFQALASGVVLIVTLLIILRETPISTLSLRGAWSALRDGWSLFVYKGSVSLYASSNTLLVGLLARSQSVGFYSSADKLIRAAGALSGPILQAFFPRLSRQASEDVIVAAASVRRLLAWFVGWSLLLAGAVTGMAPYLVRLLFGPAYEAVIPTLGVMAWVLPLSAFSSVLGIQWMIPLRKDAQYTRIVLFGGLLNVILALVLVPPFEHLGMAVAALISEGLVALAIYVRLSTLGLLPWKNRSSQETPTSPQGGSHD